MSVSLTPLPVLWAVSSSGVAISNFIVIVLLRLITFYFVAVGCYPLEACSFLMRDRKGVDPEGRGGRE